MGVVITGGKGSTDGTVLAKAKGLHAHAEGQGTATGNYAHAEGGFGQATGNNSHAEGESTASGAYSHAEAMATASGDYSHAEGQNSVASWNYTHAEGYATTASGETAHAEGSDTVASGRYSHAQGQYAVANRYAQDAQASFRFATSGDAQFSRLTLGGVTTSSTGVTLTFNGSASIAATNILTANVLLVPASRSYTFRLMVVARRTDGGAEESAGWTIQGLVARGASGNATLVGYNTIQEWSSSAGAASWDVSPSIDTTDATNNYLKITAGGEPGKTVRWVASLELIEVS